MGRGAKAKGAERMANVAPGEDPWGNACVALKWKDVRRAVSLQRNKAS